MKPLILILATEAGGTAMTWIGTNAPHFRRPDHDIVATMEPTAAQIKAAYCILIPEPQNYLAIQGKAAKNLVFLSAGIDSREFLPSGLAIRQTIHLFDWMLGIVLGAARSQHVEAGQSAERAAAADEENAALHERIAVLESRIAQLQAPAESTGVTPERAAEIEFDAGKAVAEAGHPSLPDLATEAAKAGFASASDPENKPPDALAPNAPADRLAGVRKKLKDAKLGQ